MVKRLLLSAARWIHTKVLLFAASIYFVRQLSKTLKNTNQKKGDTLKDKSKHIMSGSQPVEQKMEEVTTTNAPQIKKLEVPADFNIDVSEIEEALQKILDSDWGTEIADTMNTPMYMLSFENDFEYLYSLNRKTFVPVKNNIEVIPVDASGIAGMSLSNFFAINEEVFDIDPEKVVCIGWN